ncbi:unnamed protein product [Calypogeia fissa]
MNERKWNCYISMDLLWRARISLQKMSPLRMLLLSIGIPKETLIGPSPTARCPLLSGPAKTARG